MPAAVQPTLMYGNVYRTEDFRRYGQNPTRLAKRLVKEGKLHPLAHGLYLFPRQSKFGQLPPDDAELMRRFLRDSPFLLSGSDRWNALGLGSTAVLPVQLVYNRKRTGEFTFGGRRFLLRRVRFPTNPAPEYFAVDLLLNHRMAGASLAQLERGLVTALRTKVLRPETIRANASRYGTKAVGEVVERAVQAAASEA